MPAIGICGTYLLLLFPDGRLPSPRWRWVLHLSTFVIVGGTLSLVLTPGLMGDAGYPHTVNPLGVDALAACSTIAHGILILLPLAMLLSAASVVVRFRHAGAVERTQITWLAAAASTVVVIYALVLPMSAAVDHSGVPPTWLQAAQAVALLSFGLIPAAVLVAVLRYRLYEIDVIIRRTVTYTVLAAVLGVTYLAGIWLLGWLLRSLTGASGALAVTLSTLAVGPPSSRCAARAGAGRPPLLPQPLRRRPHAGRVQRPAARPARPGGAGARDARRSSAPPSTPATPSCGCAIASCGHEGAAERPPGRGRRWPGRRPCRRCSRPARRRCPPST